MQPVARDELLALARDAGDVDERDAAPFAFLPRGRVERVDLHRDLPAHAAFRERRRAPVGDRQHEHAAGPIAGERDRARQQRGKLLFVFVERPAAILVVHADEQRHEAVRRLELRVVHRGRELVRGPAGLRDDHGRVQRMRAATQQRRELHGPAPGRLDALADRVGIAEREVRRRRPHRRHCHRERGEQARQHGRRAPRAPLRARARARCARIPRASRALRVAASRGNGCGTAR